MVRKLIIDCENCLKASEILNECWTEITDSRTRFCDAEHCRFIKKYLIGKLGDAYLLFFYRNLHMFDDKFNIQVNLIRKVLKQILKDKKIDIIKTELSFRYPEEE